MWFELYETHWCLEPSQCCSSCRKPKDVTAPESPVTGSNAAAAASETTAGQGVCEHGSGSMKPAPHFPLPPRALQTQLGGVPLEAC